MSAGVASPQVVDHAVADELGALRSDLSFAALWARRAGEVAGKSENNGRRTLQRHDVLLSVELGPMSFLESINARSLWRERDGFMKS
jgi:hypothetical protein